MLFSNLFQFISSWLHGSCSSFAFRVLWLFCFVLHTEIVFFDLKFSNCSPLKLIFSEDPSFHVRSVCNHGALKMRPHVVALPASLTMSWPTESTWNFNRSGLDFLVLNLQSLNSFFLNAVSKFSSVNFFLATWFMFRFCLQGLFVVLLFFSPYDDWIFGFLVWKFQTIPS